MTSRGPNAADRPGTGRCRGAALLASTPGQLVTLVGPPGIGKTRLSLQVAAELRSVFPDGVHFVPLAAIRDPELILPAIAQALRCAQAGGQPLLDHVRQVLAGKQVLLVLDNVEQIVEAAPVVGDVARSLPQLKVLVTSRVPLHLYGEQEYAVPPLAVPDLRGDPSVEALAQVELVRLFVQRAQAVQFDFRITPHECRGDRGDLPAAGGPAPGDRAGGGAHQAVATGRAAQRLGQSLDVLTGGAPNLPPRHRTLRAPSPGVSISSRPMSRPCCAGWRCLSAAGRSRLRCRRSARWAATARAGWSAVADRPEPGLSG